MTKPATKLTTLLLTYAPFSFAQDSAPEASDTSAMLILDASGSMWQKIGDQTPTERQIKPPFITHLVSLFS